MYWLTEWVRILEQRGHIFPTDPVAMTEILRQTDGDLTHKLHRRAQLIDRNQELATRLDTHRRRLRWALWGASIVWFVLGFCSTYALMQNSSLNFLLLLASVLGINTMMLLIWLMGLFLPHKMHTPHTLFFTGKQDAMAQALITLYSETATQARARWVRGAISHRLALCGLGGMFLAMLLRLLVRQYQFNWESTLLNGETFAQLLAALAWLPEKIGFAIPTDNMVAAAQNAYHPEHAATWGSLLLGSLLIYGMVPRFIAWLFCQYQRHHTALTINLQLPYYQNIIQKWQQKIVDTADDYRADAPTPAAATISLDAQGERWAVLLDAPHDNAQWFAHALGQEWTDKGVLAERQEYTTFLDALAVQPVQLLVGVRAHIAPDRGTIRQLAKFAQTAQAGMVIQFITPKDTAIHHQWHDVVTQNGWLGIG